MKLIIFILSYNDETYNFAYEKYNKYWWAKVIKIDSSIYFESIMFDKWLIENYSFWMDYDYIGFLSWKFQSKIPYPNIDLISTILNYDNSYELIPLFVGNKNFLFYEKHMYDILQRLFIILEYPDNYIINTNFIQFYCNYWIARKDILINYIFFFKKCNEIVKEDKFIQQYMWDNTNYNGYLNEEQLIKIFNKPYYCYHPFLYERLPIFFFHNKKMLIL
jgi:hypothetical protein